MATDRDNQSKDGQADRTNAPDGEKRVIGKGMTSPDSTQVPLKAETGEPDYDAIKGRVAKDEDPSRA